MKVRAKAVRRMQPVGPEPLEPRRLLAGVPLRVIVASGQPAPGLPAGITLAPPDDDTYGGHYPAINDAGDIVFTNRIAGPGVTEFEDDLAEFFLPGAGTGRAPVAIREGDPVPGRSDFLVNDPYAFPNNAGNIVLTTHREGPTLPGIQAVFAGPPDALRRREDRDRADHRPLRLQP